MCLAMILFTRLYEIIDSIGNIVVFMSRAVIVNMNA